MFFKKKYIERDIVDNFEKDGKSENVKFNIDIDENSKTSDDLVSTQATPIKCANQDWGSSPKKNVSLMKSR